MHAILLFIRFSPNKTFVAILIGLVSGGLYASLIPIIMMAVAPEVTQIPQMSINRSFLGFEVSNYGLAVIFFFMCLFILIFNTLSESILIRISMDIRTQLRRELYSRLRHAPIEKVETLGTARLIQSLSTDVSAIVNGAQALPNLLTNAVIILSMMAYLAYLDTEVFFFIGKTVLCGAILHQSLVYLGTRYFSVARDGQDRLQEAFVGAVEGIKELKLSDEKYEVFEKELLLKEEILVRDLHKKAYTVYTVANNYGDLVYFFAIGILSFIFINYHQLSDNQLAAIVMILIYLSGPIGMILQFMPTLSLTKISLNKIHKIFDELAPESISANQEQVINWTELNLQGVCFKYRPEIGRANNSIASGFGIGPLDLCIKRGKITFIAGGNGSGKSTLAKVISMLYLPTQGKIKADKELLTAENIGQFRQSVSCIFSDYHLFPRLLVKNNIIEEKVALFHKYLKEFNLEGKVELVDNTFSTLALSDGQKRRLALIVAMLDDAQLYVFDEWAADQDPDFKRVFYCEILPDLKKRGAAVVVISHDDRYFECADELVMMEYGRVKESPSSIPQIVSM